MEKIASMPMTKSYVVSFCLAGFAFVVLRVEGLAAISVGPFKFLQFMTIENMMRIAEFSL
jgi:hypothetical protein